MQDPITEDEGVATVTIGRFKVPVRVFFVLGILCISVSILLAVSLLRLNVAVLPPRGTVAHIGLTIISLLTGILSITIAGAHVLQERRLKRLERELGD